MHSEIIYSRFILTGELGSGFEQSANSATIMDEEYETLLNEVCDYVHDLLTVDVENQAKRLNLSS